MQQPYGSDGDQAGGLMHVFDGHNDVLSRLWQLGDDPVARFEDNTGHINAKSSKAGGFAGGFFAIYPPTARVPPVAVFDEDGRLFEPLPDPLEPGWALQATMAQAGIAHRLQDAGHIQIVTRAEELGAAFLADPLACILHLEGADGIDEDLLALETLHAAGLRSVGPVWSRPNIFGHGVPFAHRRDGNTGQGLTEAGLRLVARCQHMGILLDTSHITIKGFWQIAELGAPVIATHSNAWALCQSSRNLTDDQLDCIAQSDGIVGFNFEPAFISETGWKTGQASLEDCLHQLDYLVSKLGEGRVALGSDFDGARTPQGIGGASDLPKLVQAMREHGFGESLIAGICHENWLAFLSRSLSN